MLQFYLNGRHGQTATKNVVLEDKFDLDFVPIKQKWIKHHVPISEWGEIFSHRNFFGRNRDKIYFLVNFTRKKPMKETKDCEGLEPCARFGDWSAWGACMKHATEDRFLRSVSQLVLDKQTACSLIIL